MPRILLIDDDERLADLLGRFFERYDLELDSAVLPSEGLNKLAQEAFDLVILDVMLPEMDGFEVCKEIRKANDIPIIMLTARGEVMDRIVGLELGADDYLAKPFEPRELVARIHTVLKRLSSSNNNQETLNFGSLSLDLQLQQAMLNNEELQLSSGEYQLLTLLATNPGKTFSRDEIMNNLRGTETEIYSRAIDILVSRLRQKLKPAAFIKTIRGRGYCFVGKNT
ncbi:response regulator transcription factor [Pseudomonadota bacterium]